MVEVSAHLVDLLLVRRLQALQTNVGKRLVKSSRVYVRDSGLVHALLGIADRAALLGHPVAGASWDDHYLRGDGVEVIGVRGLCEIVGAEARG